MPAKPYRVFRPQAEILVFAISCPSRDTSPMPGEIAKTFDIGASNVFALPKRKDVESRPPQRDAPAHANAGPQPGQ